MNNKHNAKNFLILGCNEANVKWDLRHIKTFKPKSIHVASSASEAFSIIAEKDINAVISEYALKDMDAVELLITLKQRFKENAPPVILLTSENRRDKVLDAISSGCSGYILRPYSKETFERHLAIAFEMESFGEIDRIQLAEAKDMVRMENFDDAIEAFEEIVAEVDESRRYFDMGCRYLLDGKYGKAIIAFNRAIKINELFAEAYKGLADAYKGKGDVDRYQENLQRAMELHARFDRFDEVRRLFVEAIKTDSKSPNPFNTLGVNLRKQGDIEGALSAYRKALELTPEDENIHYNIAKALYLAGGKAEAREAVSRALSMNPGFDEARALYRLISGKDWAEAGAAEAGRGAALVDA